MNWTHCGESSVRVRDEACKLKKMNTYWKMSGTLSVLIPSTDSSFVHLLHLTRHMWVLTVIHDRSHNISQPHI